MMSLLLRKTQHPFVCLSKAYKARAFSSIEKNRCLQTKCLQTRLANFEKELTNTYITENTFLNTAHNHLSDNVQAWLLKWTKEDTTLAYTHCGNTARVVRAIGLKTLFNKSESSEINWQSGLDAVIHDIFQAISCPMGAIAPIG